MKSALLAVITSFDLENDWLQKFERLDMVKMYSQRKKWEQYCLDYLQYDPGSMTKKDRRNQIFMTANSDPYMRHSVSMRGKREESDQAWNNSPVPHHQMLHITCALSNLL